MNNVPQRFNRGAPLMPENGKTGMGVGALMPNLPPEQAEKLNRLARNVLNLSRDTLLVHLRYLDSALNQLQLVPCGMEALLTDGQRLLYHPVYVLRMYQQEKELTVRTYLHMVLHCIFRHMFIGTNMDPELWDLACDIAVENSIADMKLPSVTVQKEARQALVLDKLRADVKMLTAEKLYRHFQTAGLPERELEEMRELFFADDHQLWYKPEEQEADGDQSAQDGSQEDQQQSRTGRQRQRNSTPDQDQDNQEDQEGQGGQGNQDGQEDQEEQEGQENQESQGGQEDQEGQGSQEDQEGQEDQKEDQQDSGESGNSSGESGDQQEDSQPDSGNGNSGTSGGSSQEEENSQEEDKNESGQSGMNRSELDQRWKDIAEHIQMELETFAQKQGDRAGGMVQNLKEVNRDRTDYGEFLRRFCVHGEVMKTDMDEFDYIFYTYGLQLTGNVPLIEQLEYREVKRIRDFVIAIDTSGSVEGATVQAFVEKTFGILRSTESFFTRINVYIIQCDAEIQEEVKITSLEQFEEYGKTMQIHGLGGTDFRPVFRRVEELRRSGEIRNLKGLIYFTDGYGTFPERKPDYQTAFVFLEDDYNLPAVPPWAIRITMRWDEIRG